MLFVIGGLVRSSGSGMGCPDWPKCFGEYVPPISESDLPSNYEEYFKNQRIVKTKRFTALLDVIGLKKKALEIRENGQLQETHQFNVVKAYVEYINRLWGALTGIIVFICFLLSIKYLQKNSKVFWFTLAGFIFVFVNALLGAVVVNSNLLGGIVTIHFIAAFASISFFILARRYAVQKDFTEKDQTTKRIGILVLILSTVQVVLGAEVRELYDMVVPIATPVQRIDAMYPTFQWHAILGALVLVVSIYQYIKLPKSSELSTYVKWVMLLSIGQMLWGPLALLEFSASISKLFHISLGAGIFILQFYICSTFINATKEH
jgi:cytochrome c oxidase assembly protein subunit 15|tara:strand:+ start:4061 stop:5017 length:957 start_codon:yes stop_codon:yes gene_type:complete